MKVEDIYSNDDATFEKIKDVITELSTALKAE